MMLVTSTISILLLKWMTLQYKNSDTFCCALAVAVSGLIALVYVAIRCRQGRKLAGIKMCGWLAITMIALMTCLGWWLYTIAMRTAPNAGYVQSILNANSMLLLVASILLFGDGLTKRAVFGCVLVFIGSILIVMTPPQKKNSNLDSSDHVRAPQSPAAHREDRRQEDGRPRYA